MNGTTASAFLAALAASLTLVSSGCGDKSSSTRPPDPILIDPANFVASIDNTYLPLVPGTVFVYQGTADGRPELDRVHVTRQLKTILGVPCRVVADTVWVDDVLEEATFDWYAQDKDGNVWYFGEDSKEFGEGGAVDTEGSWEAGVDGAMPGIVMQAHPEVGQSYRQEYYQDEAEDMAEVLGLDEAASVPYGTVQGCLRTKEWTPLEAGVVEEKYYAPGVGMLKSITVEGGSDSSGLVSISTE